MSARAVATLLHFHWWRHRVPLLPMAAAVALFELLLTRIAPAPDEVSWISAIMSSVPPELLALTGDSVAATTPSGFLAMGYGHPFLMLMLSVWVVRMSCAALAGEIGRGTMDLLAARPIGRWVHVAAGALAVASGLAVLAGAAWAGTAAGLALRPLGVAGSSLLPVAAMAWLLFLTFGIVGLVVGASAREGGAAIGWLSGIMAASFVLEYLARVWQPIGFLRPLSLFAYYAPAHIVKTGPAPADVARLIAVAVVAIVAAVVRFERRDL